MEDSAQRRWSGAVRGAIRDHCGGAGRNDTARVEQLRGHTADHLFKKQSVRISESDIFSRQCVGGDGHPVGVGRQFNDPRIFRRQFVAPFKQIEAGRVSAEASLVERSGARRHQRQGDWRMCRFHTGFALGLIV